MAWPKGRPRNPTTGEPMTEGDKIAQRAATVGAPITEAERIAAQMAAPAKRMVATAPPPKASGAKVIIGCKIPVPWIDLSLSHLIDKEISTPTGTQVRKEGVRTGEFIRIRGTSYPRAGAVPEGFPQKPMMVDGAALTPNVDEDKWLFWLEKSGGKQSPMYKSGMIFAYGTLADVRAHAAEIRDLLTGLEPLDPRTDANGNTMEKRVPGAGKMSMGKVEAGQVNSEVDTEMQLYELLEQQEQRVHQQAESDA
jgi:hypothetical protein